MSERYEIRPIGTIDNGIDGSDEYLAVRDTTGDNIDRNEVHDFIMPKYYSPCRHPGGYFCKTLRVIPDPVLEDRCIVIVQHEYDV